MVDPALLKEAPLFQSLPEEQLRALALACRTRTYRRGAVLFYEEDEASALYLIRAGKMKNPVHTEVSTFCYRLLIRLRRGG